MLHETGTYLSFTTAYQHSFYVPLIITLDLLVWELSPPAFLSKLACDICFQAQAVTLTVSQSFNVANEIWQKHEAKKKQKERENQEKVS